MLLAASLAKASSSFLFICICLSLILNRVIYDTQLHKIRYSLAALKVFLPDDFKPAVAILLASLDSHVEHDDKNSMASFMFMPHTIYVTENGLDDFDTSMQAHYQLTQKLGGFLHFSLSR